MYLNRAGLDLIKHFEGCRLSAYRDPVGIWTIGYGHTDAAGPPRVRSGLRISQAEADGILLRDLHKYEGHVRDALRVVVTPNQFSALVSFCFNVGPGNLNKSVMSRTNARRFAEVPGRLALYNKAGGRVLAGLTRRRKAEGELFLSDARSPPVRAGDAPAEPTPTTAAPERRSFWRLLAELAARLLRGGG